MTMPNDRPEIGVVEPAAVAEATRAALRRLAGSVAVVTSRHDGRRFAMSVTAVDALSLDPPAVLVCINRSTAIHPPIAAGADFAINLLGRSHEDIARACGGYMKGDERFTLGQWRDDGGAPVLEGAQATLLCRQDGRFDYGTHTIFVGRVVEAISGDVVDPLLYADGGYNGLADLSQASSRRFA